MIRLRQLGPAFIRHVEAYAQLALAAGRDMRALALRRAMLVAVAAMLGIAAVVLLGATLIAAGWETPYRGWIAAAVLAALALGAFGCLAAARAKPGASTHLQALKDEWQKDRAWLATRERSVPDPRDADPDGMARPTTAPQRTATTLHGA